MSERIGEIAGALIRAARAGAGISATELAESAGVGVSSIGRMEASDIIDVRADAARKIDGGISVEVVERVLADLRHRGWDIRPAINGWNAAVVCIKR